MASKPTKIGLVGLSAKGSWAAKSHVKYLKTTSKYAISALQNSSQEAAEASAKTYELSAAPYGSISQLVQDPNVDIVAVSVNVPRHFELVEPALLARKDVFVEWPLARNLTEAEHLTNLAKENGVRTLVGLQARQSPAIIKAKELVESGELGQIQGTTMLGSGLLYAPQMTTSYRYTTYIENGANLLTIPFGHAVDALAYVLGEWSSLSATLANTRPELTLVDDSGKEIEKVKKTSHDFISVSGTLVNGGGVASVVYQGGNSNTGKGFYWEIYGTKGSLVLEGPSGHVQMFEPSIKFASREADAELKEVEVEKVEPNDFSFNVARAWDSFAGEGKTHVTTFEDALLRHRMIDAIYRSDKNGSKESYL